MLDSQLLMGRFASNLQTLMVAQGVSQKKLAKVAGMSQGHISLLVKGKVEPTIETLNKLCKALRVTPDILMGIELPKPDHLSARELEIILAYRKMPDGERKKIIDELLALYFKRDKGN